MENRTDLLSVISRVEGERRQSRFMISFLDEIARVKKSSSQQIVQKITFDMPTPEQGFVYMDTPGSMSGPVEDEDVQTDFRTLLRSENETSLRALLKDAEDYETSENKSPPEGMWEVEREMLSLLSKGKKVPFLVDVLSDHPNFRRRIIKELISSGKTGLVEERFPISQSDADDLVSSAACSYTAPEVLKFALTKNPSEGGMAKAFVVSLRSDNKEAYETLSSLVSLSKKQFELVKEKELVEGDVRLTKCWLQVENAVSDESLSVEGERLFVAMAASDNVEMMKRFFAKGFSLSEEIAFYACVGACCGGSEKALECLQESGAILRERVPEILRVSNEVGMDEDLFQKMKSLLESLALKKGHYADAVIKSRRGV